VETLKRVAHMIAEAKGVCVLWAMGVTQHSNGSDTSTAISNLLLVTGNYMRPGTGAYPVARAQQRPGSQRSRRDAQHGVRLSIGDDPEVRARFRSGWGVDLPPPRVWTITKWSTPFTPASCGRCICAARK
jgi:formate dehydrogenase major subunit